MPPQPTMIAGPRRPSRRGLSVLVRALSSNMQRVPTVSIRALYKPVPAYAVMIFMWEKAAVFNSADTAIGAGGVGHFGREAGAGHGCDHRSTRHRRVRFRPCRRDVGVSDPIVRRGQVHFAQHLPGAAPREELRELPLKGDYRTKFYLMIHKGIVPHPFVIDGRNAHLLDGVNRGCLTKLRVQCGLVLARCSQGLRPFRQG